MTKKQWIISGAIGVGLLIYFYLSNRVFEYRISDKFSGPCMIFLYEASLPNENSDYLMINNHLARQSKGLAKRKFVFRSLETNEELEIIPIGQNDKAPDGKRCIFSLFIGKRSPRNCPTGEIEYIIFFVGTKAAAKERFKTYFDELGYFDEIGIDWCKFYLEKE